MGYQAKCNTCGQEFEVNDGGGFFFHLLHCDTCGREKSISFKKLEDVHEKFGGPHLLADGRDEEDLDEDGSLDQREDYYTKAVEEKAGLCRCGGQFRAAASPRCPKCRSVDFEQTDMNMICYD